MSTSPPPLPPPLPRQDPRAHGMAGAARGPAGAPPKKTNGCLIALAVAGALAIPMIGILAAIALPAYQTYTIRARVTQALTTARAHVEPAIAQSGSDEHAQCPTNGEAGIPEETAFGIKDVERVQVGAFEDDGACGFAVTFSGTGQSGINGKTVRMRHSSTGWSCDTDMDSNKYLPSSCREH